ncbi:DUF2339 domain-containing protein [Solirubrobacter deserti]|uniref:DUF2339 domain-containing protein n=1 Tax=Solirubrobacter deserti TaxID=2282478 RepID=A0ABT4RTK1_9ACTN|nr:DUF2339 domain-containing protein [Solirubrobacter deserti]MDA0141914.1 DUF2339 domain-containing protein [Solirubrobacter deserti]
MPNPPTPIRPPVAAPAARPKRDLEDVLGGSVLAWLGGIAVLAGLAFLLTIAISRGWLGEGARTVLAGLLSTGLLGAGIWLREHKDRTEAALAAAGVGIAGLFGTLVMAGAVYELIPVEIAQTLAFGVGATATTLGVRWKATPIGWLGLLGALWSPAALGALDDGGILFLAIAYAAGVRLVVWQRWTLLGWAAFATVTLQWWAWLWIESPSHGSTAFVLATFGALSVALALGLDARVKDIRAQPAALLVLNAALLALGLADADWWFVALAAAHAVVGLVALRIPRVSRATALVALGIGVGLADLALVELTDGLPVILGWAGPILAFAALLGARRRPAAAEALIASFRGAATPAADEPAGEPADTAADTAGTAASTGGTAAGAAAGATRGLAPRHALVARACDALFGRPHDADWYFAALGLVAQLVLALGHLLATEAPLEALAGGAPTSEALVAVGTIGAIAFLAARLSGVIVLDVLALTALAQFTGLVLEGLPLTLALAVQAALVALLDKRASLAFAALAAGHALVVLAPPTALIDGLEHPFQAAAALAAVTAALSATREGRRAIPLALLYLASVEVVTLGGAHHTGQTLLSVLWALTGVGALIFGLVSDDRTTRLAGLGLIALTAAKVFTYDLSELDSLARVASFIVFGLLLLLGAFAWQRVRPRSLL